MYARENETMDDSCVWDIMFDTNTGNEEDGGQLPLLMAAFYDLDNSSYGDLSNATVKVFVAYSREVCLVGWATPAPISIYQVSSAQRFLLMGSVSLQNEKPRWSVCSKTLPCRRTRWDTLSVSHLFIPTTLKLYSTYSRTTSRLSAVEKLLR